MPHDKIAYVVKRYPRFSETFIVNEILAHEAAACSLEVFSLRPPADTHFQDLISRVRAPVTYMSDGRVKAEELWGAVTNLCQVLPGAESRLACAALEGPLEAYCGLRLAIESVRRGVGHIHAHFASSAASVARIASILSGIPYSITAHAKDIFHRDVDPSDLNRKFDDASLVITVSDFNQRYLRTTYKNSAPKIVRLYNGIHLDDFGFQSPRTRKPQIVAVGRFVEKKGFRDLVSACGILRDRGVPFNCLLIGSGELEGPLRVQIEHLGLTDRVKLVGPQPQHVVKQLIRESAVMAAPCVECVDGDRDGMPTVLLESMALGTPCVSTDVTGIPEIIRHEYTGLLVPQGVPNKLSFTLEWLLADGSLREKLARAARTLIENEFDAVKNTARQRALFYSCRTPSLVTIGSSRSDFAPPELVEAR